jgi:lipopolysaccharide biosynthesis regulator YciM
MGKVTFFFIAVFAAIVILLAIFNQGSVDVTVWTDTMYSVPIIALIFISSLFGLLSMGIYVAIRDTRRYLESWQIQRQQKKEKKMHELYSKGLDAFHASRFDEATDLFTNVIEDEPNHMDALIRLGDILLSKDDVIGAKDFYLRAREVKPRNIEVLLSLEKLSRVQHKWQEALKCLDDVLEIDDANVHILRRKRNVYEKLNKWEELLDVQQKILKCKLSEDEEQEENRNLTGYKCEMARHQIETGDTDKAVKALKGIMKTDTNFIEAYLTLAEAYLKNGNTKEAEDILLKGYEATSALVFLAKLEEYYIAEGEPGTIIDLYQKAIQKKQDDVKLQFLLAKLYYRLEMIDYADETLNAIDISSFDYSGLHALKGCVYERRSQHEQAVESFKKALNVDDPLLVPYCCSRCGEFSDSWSGRCPGCKNWNSFILDVNEVCKVDKRQSSS